MNAVPALVAGVERVVMATPAQPDGSLHPAVLVAARELGISKIVKAGGAYGIGALAFGIGPAMPPCDVVAGPGNVYVNEAKRQLWGEVGTDFYAGPSEVAVYVDETTEPAFAAADLLTQVEHAEDNVAYLISTDRAVLDGLLVEVEKQLKGAAREATMRTALSVCGVGLVVNSEEEAAEAINEIAPEHLSLLGGDPEGMADLIRNAGAILLGAYSAQSAGDFAAGPSHTLPTGRAARFASPVNVLTFMKLSSISHLQATELMELLPTIEAFGEMEGFPAHARGAAIRFGDRGS
jgi:histidinol dehydrogenase